MGLAYSYREGILAASLADTVTPTKALRALVAKKDRIRFSYEPEDGQSCSEYAFCEQPVLHVASIGEGYYHLVLLTRKIHVLPCGDDDHLYDHLSSRFSTPLKREWTPEIRKHLVAGDGIVSPSCIGHVQVEYVPPTVTNDYMDHLVTSLVQLGSLSI